MTSPVRLAAVSYIERADGRLLCVWNRRYGGWSLPGGMIENGETAEDAQARELFEETGCATVSRERIYEGPTTVLASEPSRAKHLVLFRVVARGVPRETETGCPVTWFTREEFLSWSPFAPIYRRIFSLVPPGSRP